MNAQPQKDVFLNNTIYYVEYPNPDSQDVVLFLHGKGERSFKMVAGKEVAVTDGSLLSRVVKLGWPKEADNGFKFPFNLLVPQITLTYSLPNKYLIKWARKKYPNGKIWLAGISLGSIAVEDLIKGADANEIFGITSCCGRSSTLNIDKSAAVIGQAYHGTLDIEVPFKADKNFIIAYNTYHLAISSGGRIEFIEIPDAGHSIWNDVYSVEPGKDRALQFVIQHLKS